MNSFPWKSSEMTWFHHRLFGACEEIIAEKTSGKASGRHVRTVTGDTSRFDRLEEALRGRARQ